MYSMFMHLLQTQNESHQNITEKVLSYLYLYSITINLQH